MKTKVCTRCGIEKPVSKFYKNRNTNDKLNYECANCCREKLLRFQRTPWGLATKIYIQQIANSKLRNHPPPTYSKEKLYNWIVSKPQFKKLYDKWVSSGYNKMLIPSCDRRNDYRPYTLRNLQLVTFKENLENSYSNIRNGINRKQCRAVIQRMKNGTFVAKYYSIKEAERKTGIFESGISSTCRGRVKTAGGFKWEYAD